MKKIILNLFLVAGLMAAPTTPINNPTFTGTQTDSSTATHSGAHTFNGNAFFPSLAGGVAIFDPTTGLLNKGTAGVDYQAPLTFLSPLSNSGGNVSIGNAAADGVTKGAATFNSSYFTASSGVITPADSGVTATSYGDSTHTVTITFDAKGRATAASSNALTSASVGLGSVTNDAQTKAAIVPNTVPSAGQIHVGNAGGTAFGLVSMGSDATMDSTGAVTLTNGSSTRSHLGLTIGTNVQSWSAQLDTFASNGSSFYLNASNLNAGTLPDARFPATLPAASGINLTALNASNLGSGTVPDARFPATLPALSGVNLTALNASNLGSGTVPDARFPATLPALSGANLTSLNASNISAGALPAGRYSSSDTIRTNIGVYPIGTIANSALDSGTWLTMNGQVVSQSTYATLFGIVGHQPEFNWQYTTSPTFTATCNAVCYGNSGTYVSVGNSGTIYTSTNLTSWTSRTSGVATNLNAVTWDSTNSLFIAVGSSNVILTSPDGTTWTSRTSGVTSTLVNIVYDGAEDVATGTSGWVTYSTNGTTWTAVQPNSNLPAGFIWHTRSVWMVGPSTASSGGIAYSTNGTTWNYISRPTTNQCILIGFDNTNFYIEDATTGEIWYSTNGASWTDSAVQVPSTNSSVFYGASFSNGTISFACPYTFYTTNGFSSITRCSQKLWFGLTPATNQSPLSEPSLDPSQKFAIFQGSSQLLFYTVDGTNYSCDSKPVQAVPSIGFPKRHWNGYFIFPVTSSRLMYAPDPYDTSTQFQIPTRVNDAGSNLVIKALN